MPRMFGLGGGAKIGMTSGPASIAQRDFDDDLEFEDGPSSAVAGTLRGGGGGYDPRTAILKPQNMMQGGGMAANQQQFPMGGGAAVQLLLPSGAQAPLMMNGSASPQSMYGGANISEIAKSRQAKAADVIKSEMSAAHKAEEEVRRRAFTGHQHPFPEFPYVTSLLLTPPLLSLVVTLTGQDGQAPEEAEPDNG